MIAAACRRLSQTVARASRSTRPTAARMSPRAVAGAGDPSPARRKRAKREHVELKVEHASDVASTPPSKPTKNGRRVSTSAVASPPPAFAPPSDWRETLAIIKRMRAVGGAPVDTMGCEKISEDVAEDARGRRFVVLVSAMLSSQTKDPITHAATARLVAHGCTPENIAATSEEVLDELITPVGFHARKAQYLKRAAKMCVDEHGGDIPPTVEALMALPGVGPKMAYLVMNVGWGVAAGICVDVHVHRIAERLGWVPSVATGENGSPKKNRTPEDTRVALEGWLPREEWVEINPLLVGHGQLTCTPRAPKCAECELSGGGGGLGDGKGAALCPSAFSWNGSETESGKKAAREEKE